MDSDHEKVKKKQKWWEIVCIIIMNVCVCVWERAKREPNIVGGQITRADREKIFFMFSCYICVTTSYTWMAIHLESISYTCSVRARVANKTHEKDTKHEATTLNGDIKEKRRDQGRWTNIIGTRARVEPNEQKCTAFQYECQIYGRVRIGYIIIIDRSRAFM